MQEEYNTSNNKLSLNETKSVADLARLELSEESLEKLSRELSEIFGYVDRLGGVRANYDGKLSQVINELSNTPRRADSINDNDELERFRDDFLDIAPQQEGRFFKVPKMTRS